MERDVVHDADYVGSPEEKQILDNYVGPDYDRINGFLRGGPEESSGDRADANRRMVEALNQLFEDHPPLSRDVTTLRGLKNSSWLPEGNLAGQKLEIKGFVSTTFDPTAADRFFTGDTVIEVRVPKGLKALPVAGVQGEDYLDEHELLLQHGTIFDIIDDSTKHFNDKDVRWLTVIASPPSARSGRVP